MQRDKAGARGSQRAAPKRESTCWEAARPESLQQKEIDPQRTNPNRAAFLGDEHEALHDVLYQQASQLTCLSFLFDKSV
jgi:hypothetical protein